MNYRESLVGILQCLKPRIGIEVGVHKGALSEHLLKSLPGLFLYMVDPYTDHEEYPNQERNKKLAHDRTRKMECRKIYDASRRAAVIDFPVIDFVFIDADHSEESVYEDMNLWWPHVREGGIFSGHDYGKGDIPGVTKAVKRWFSENDREFGVAEGNIWWCMK